MRLVPAIHRMSNIDAFRVMFPDMNDLSLQAILENADAWPEEDRRELADYARVIKARRQGFYALNDVELASIQEGLDDADNGRFVSSEQLAASAKRFGA